MHCILVAIPGAAPVYSAYGWIGGRYVTGLGLTHSHAITVALNKVISDNID